MTLRMNESTLILQYGFKVVGVYKKFEQQWDKSWSCVTAKCLQNGDNCIIKLYGKNGKSFTLAYDSKDKANQKIRQLIEMGYKKEIIE